jgi:hypothetical protein
MSNSTTLFDLNQTASAAAVAALGKDEFTTEALKLEAFTSAGYDHADFPIWHQYFTGALGNYTSLKAQLSPAAKAAAAAAAKTSAAAPKALS